MKAKSDEINRLQKDMQELKSRNRLANDTANQKVKKKTDELSLMHEWVEEMSLEVKQSKRQLKSEQKKTKSGSVTSNRRLEAWRNLKAEVAELKDKLAECSENKDERLEQINHVRKQIKKERVLGRRGGSQRWPLHVIMLVCELICDGVPPARVAATMQTTSAFFTGEEAEELPSISTIRECRAVIQTLNDLLAAYKLAGQENWHQLFTDGTTRRQIGFQCLVIGYLTAADSQSVIASSCICSEDETSEAQVEGIQNKIKEMKDLLREW